MRTKSLLAVAALLATGAASSMAQNVYSLNVVGYVNTVIEGGGAFNLIANPLNNTTGNGVTNLFKNLPGSQDGANVFKWDATTFDFQGTIPTYGSFSGAWDVNVNLPVGEAFFYVNPGSTFTNTFVGEVIQGSYTNNVLGSGSFNAVGSSVPVGGSFTNAIGGLVPTDGDNIFAWDVNTFEFQGTIPTYGTFSGTWDTTALNLKVGEGFFYVRQGGNASWVRNFTVQ